MLPFSVQSLDTVQEAPQYSKSLYVRIAFLEVLGTFVFVLLSALCPGSWEVGCLLATVIYFTDGTHLNPNVSLSAYLTKRIKFAMMLVYVLAQMFGTIAAVMIQRWGLYITGGGNYLSIYGNNYGPVFGWELFATYIFLLLVHAVALRMKSSDFALPDKSVRSVSVGPVLIGLAVTSLQLTIGTVCVVWFNPARLIADAVILRVLPVRYVFLRLAAEILGTFCASATALYALH